MHKCFKCGTEFEGAFCPECGTQWQEQKHCPQCGAVLSGSAKFCNSCGYSFVKSKKKKVMAWLKVIIPTALACAAVATVLAYVPTFSAMTVNGTYYYSANGELSKTDCITLSSGKWKNGDLKGTYSYSFGNITLKYKNPAMEDLGEILDEDIDTTVKLTGTVKNGVLTVADANGNHEQVYVSKSHSHKYGDWEISREPTCTAEGERHHICACKKAETEAVEALGHSYDKKHTCVRCEDVTGHLAEGDICIYCKNGYINGLELKENNNGDGYVVISCDTGLSEVIIPDYCNGKPVVAISQGVFKDRTSITRVKIGNNVTSIGNSAFENCSELGRRYYEGEGSEGEAEDTTPETHDGEYNEEYTVTIPNSVTSIGRNAFKGCNRIIQTVSGVQYVDKWVIGCSTSLASVTLRSDTVGIADYAFYDCSGLTSITIPNGVTSIGSDAFRGCSGLTSITIPNSVTNIGEYAFYNCSGLTSITIPNSVTSIGEYAFYKCSALTSITIPNSVTSIGDHTFYNCGGLTSVTIPDSVTSIGELAFGGCSGLTSVTIGNSVTRIGDYAFYKCSALTNITIPNRMTYIGEYAFYNCSELTRITFLGTKNEWQAIKKFTRWNYNTGDYTVQCTNGKLDKDGNEIA